MWPIEHQSKQFTFCLMPTGLLTHWSVNMYFHPYSRALFLNSHPQGPDNWIHVFFIFAVWKNKSSKREFASNNERFIANVWYNAHIHSSISKMISMFSMTWFCRWPYPFWFLSLSHYDNMDQKKEYFLNGTIRRKQQDNSNLTARPAMTIK